METWAGCAFPSEILYDLESDTWVRADSDELVTIGMTDVSQTRCGRLVQVGWKTPGRKISRGRPLCVIESAKWVGPLRSPVSGVIFSNNEKSFVDDIAVANRDPYGTGWFYKIRLDNPEELEELTPSAQAFEHYRRVIDESELRCYRCED